MSLAFLFLVLAQVAHSVEEYLFRLYAVFLPARLVSRIFSSDLRTGFLIVNAGVCVFGFWCYFLRVRPGHRSARNWIWPWAIVEFGNGVGHVVFATMRGSYFPGLLTAPILIATSIYLAAQLVRTGRVTVN